MALPPNGLTVLLYGCRSPEKMVDALARRGCLTPEGLRDRQGLIGLIQGALRSCEDFYHQHPDWTGPNAIDYIGEALTASLYLSQHGRQLYQTDARDGR